MNRFVDIVTPDIRSRIMSGIRGKHTKPELLVRKAAHGLGLRYRLHRTDLPGTPDLVFVRKNTVVFVHGCYWHRHEKCKYCYIPKSNTDFWNKKFESNVARDRRVREELKQMGWRVMVIWECETRDFGGLQDKLRASLIA
ncbi:very short patch repair endonuclease [Ahrensia marina]|uniref:very short patch repair endonuclease n=1 Tax=Ahrensia marina TaxID=1514904 RepID=UPI0035D0124F